MLWIKRNLFIAAGGLIALILLGIGGFYLFGNYRENRRAEEELERTRGELSHFYQQSPFPHRTNVDSAKRETERVRGAIAECKKYFQPIPYTNVTGLEFKKVLEAAIAGLQQEARDHGVRITNVAGRLQNFSFDAERVALTFTTAAFPALPQQLADVQRLCSILFQSKIYELVSVRRWRIPGYSEGAALSDYHEAPVETNTVVGASLHPYELKFVCYSQDFASVLENFSRSSHGFNIKPQLIEPLPEVVAGPNAPGGVLPGFPRPPFQRFQPRPTVQRDPYVTAIDEERFVVTLLVQIVKPSN